MVAKLEIFQTWLRPFLVLIFNLGPCNTTRSNKICQFWSTQVPHTHDFFDTYGWTDNQCRKVDHDAPWCYTTDPDKRWEECDCNKKDGMKKDGPL